MDPVKEFREALRRGINHYLQSVAPRARRPLDEYGSVDVYFQQALADFQAPFPAPPCKDMAIPERAAILDDLMSTALTRAQKAMQEYLEHPLVTPPRVRETRAHDTSMAQYYALVAVGASMRTDVAARDHYLDIAKKFYDAK